MLSVIWLNAPYTVCTWFELRQWQVGLWYSLCKFSLNVCASQCVCVCMHVPSVHCTLIAIPSGRQESAGLLWDICTFIRLYWSSRCSTKRGPVPLFHHFFFAPLLPCLSPILPSLTIFYTLCYFSTRPCSNISLKCSRRSVSGFVRLVQRGRKELECMTKFWTSWTWTQPLRARPYTAAPRCIPHPQFVMAYDFTASPLILQHFCHFNPPHPVHPASPLSTSSPPHLLVLLHFHSHQPSFRHYLSVNTSHCLDPQNKWCLPPGGSLASTLQTPTDM